MKIKITALTLLAMCLGLGVMAQAGTDAAKKTAHIPQLMRENGFKHSTASWTTVMTVTDEKGKAKNSESKMWLSGDKYRMESKDQKEHTVAYLDDGKDVYMINLDEKKAYKWGPSVEKLFGSVISGDLVAESARQRKSAKKLGSETVEGKPCSIYAYKSTVNFMDNAVTSDVKEWIWTKENFPIKNQTKTPQHTMKIVFMTTEVPASQSESVVKELVLDKPVDESLFTLPAGIKVETLEMPAASNSGQSAAPAAQEPKPAEEKADKAAETKTGEQVEKKQDGPPPVVKDLLKGLF